MVIAETTRLRVGPCDIDVVPLDDAARRIVAGELTGPVHLCNAYTVALADERRDLAEAIARGSANLPDGMPLVWWAKRHGLPSAERVYGPDLMERVLDLGREQGTRHYLFGSTPEVLEALRDAIGERWPGSAVAGAESPPFRDLTDDELRASLSAMAAVNTDVVWVGMGTPKQDFLVQRLTELHSDLHPERSVAFVAIGAAFDFIAGTKRQAPRWVMRLGMEWAYRLATEPRRLWKRYLVYNWKFVRVLRRTAGVDPQWLAPSGDN